MPAGGLDQRLEHGAVRQRHPGRARRVRPHLRIIGSEYLLLLIRTTAYLI